MAAGKPNKWVAKLMSMDGAVTLGEDIHKEVLTTGSPSIDFTFGNGHGLPFGYTLLLYGPPKGGKSLIVSQMISQLHKNDPEAVCVRFDTEARTSGQLLPAQLELLGIDTNRLVVFETNAPEMVYDRIANDINAMCQEGLKVKLIVIDSIQGIRGRRSMNSDTVSQMQIGDDAMTNQVGLKMILPVIRKHKIAMVIVSQIRAEMDVAEQMKGNKIKPGVAFAVGHFSEYAALIEPNRTKDGKKDLLGADMIDDSVNANISGTNKEGQGDRTGHRIRWTLKDSSLGPKGRVGEMTYDYTRGIVMKHEEVYLLGVARNVIERPNNATHVFKDKKWTGKPAMLAAIRDEPDLYKAILDEVRGQDLKGVLPTLPHEE